MARGGRSDLNVHEDAIFAMSSLVFDFVENPTLRPSIRNVLLSHFDATDVEKFVSAEFFGDLLRIVFVLSHDGGGERAALKKKYADLSKAIRATILALMGLSAEEYYLAGFAATVGVSDERGSVAEFSRLSDTDAQAARTIFRETNRGELHRRLAIVEAGAFQLSQALSGTAQNKNRPLRVLTIGMLNLWIECGLPIPTWSGTADMTDPDGEDPEPFRDMLHIIRPTLLGRPSANTLDHVIREVLRAKKKFGTVPTILARA